MLALESCGLSLCSSGVWNVRIVEERGRFWNSMDRTMDRIGNGYRLYVLGDLNRCIGDRVRAGITDAFGVQGENKNERRVVEF